MADSISIASQLHQAWLRQGDALEDLRVAAGLECSADSLSRKLRGKQILTTEEAEHLAQALDTTITWTPARRGRRRAA